MTKQLYSFVSNRSLIAICLICAARLAIAAETTSSEGDARPIPTGAGLRILNVSSQIERIIAEEEDFLDKISGFSTSIMVGEVESTISTPHNGVVVSIEQINAIMQNSKVKHPHEVVEYIIAHEKAHQIQYKTYGERFVLDDDLDRRRTMECQADILAGKYVMERTNYNDEDAEGIVRDLMQVPFDLGTGEYENMQHPSHEARRLAVRLGMAAGVITQMQQYGNNPAAQANIRVVMERADIRSGETTLEWSLRQAKRIVHSSPTAGADIVAGDPEIKWNTSQQNPTVDFRVDFTNIGTHPIVADLGTSIYLVRKDRPDDTSSYRMGRSKHEVLNIAPGQTASFAGTLNWIDTVADSQKWMPHITMPPEPQALMSFRYADDTQPKTVVGTELVKRQLAVAETRGDFDFKWSIEHCIIALQSNPKELRAGPGSRSDDSDDFPCFIRIPGMEDVRVVFPRSEDEQPNVDVDVIASTKDGDEASAVYAVTKERLLKVFDAKSGWTSDSSDQSTGTSSTSVSAFSSTSGARIRLRHTEYRKSGKHFVSLRIYPPEKQP